MHCAKLITIVYDEVILHRIAFKMLKIMIFKSKKSEKGRKAWNISDNLKIVNNIYKVSQNLTITFFFVEIYNILCRNLQYFVGKPTIFCAETYTILCRNLQYFVRKPTISCAEAYNILCENLKYFLQKPTILSAET